MKQNVALALEYIEHAGHWHDCESEQMKDGTCTCGYDALLALIRELTKNGDNHILVISEPDKEGNQTWVVEHSLGCRLDGNMAMCYATTNTLEFEDTILKAFPPGRYKCFLRSTGSGRSTSFDLYREDGKAIEFRGVSALEGGPAPAKKEPMKKTAVVEDASALERGKIEP